MKQGFKWGTLWWRCEAKAATVKLSQMATFDRIS